MLKMELLTNMIGQDSYQDFKSHMLKTLKKVSLSQPIIDPLRSTTKMECSAHTLMITLELIESTNCWNIRYKEDRNSVPKI
jgi:hypothetical protein